MVVYWLDVPKLKLSTWKMALFGLHATQYAMCRLVAKGPIWRMKLHDCTQQLFQQAILTGPQRHRHGHLSWWRHQMETFSAFLALCERNPWVNGGFPSQKPVTRNFDVCLTCVWTNGWANNRDAGDLGRHCTHYYVIVMSTPVKVVTLFNDVWVPASYILTEACIIHYQGEYPVMKRL